MSGLWDDRPTVCICNQNFRCSSNQKKIELSRTTVARLPCEHMHVANAVALVGLNPVWTCNDHTFQVYGPCHISQLRGR